MKDGKVYIYRKSAGISYAAAVRRGKYNKEFKDVWSISRSYAKKVAQGVNPKGSPINETNLSIKNKMNNTIIIIRIKELQLCTHFMDLNQYIRRKY